MRTDRSAATLLLLLALALASCGGVEIDPRATAAALARSACLSTSSCTVTCGDGSTLDGRPAYSRCR